MTKINKNKNKVYIILKNLIKAGEIFINTNDNLKITKNIDETD